MLLFPEKKKKKKKRMVITILLWKYKPLGHKPEISMKDWEQEEEGKRKGEAKSRLKEDVILSFPGRKQCLSFAVGREDLYCLLFS